ncbi:hypothetical protein [Acanthamoeba polyphaga mimivirus]|nr:hypothetical protein [Acanthamoeba castellanii mamavirus]EJN40964.1 hypothetical protein lvs_L461 [Acanthamoeba polyphaga lentillevirus]UMZ07939.1 hypothetical protein [Acanthamoeba polyphaga mimivirus]
MELLDKAVTDFQLFYQKILDLYESDFSPAEKWTEIATHIHDNQQIPIGIYKLLRQNDTVNQIDIDYKSDLEQLNSKISLESDFIVKSSLIIASMHFIIYDMITREGNYSSIMYGSEEMNIPSVHNMIYYVYISTKNQQNIYFHAYILLFGLESIFNKKFYVGMDFEFTNKKIQLSQLNFEHNVSTKSIIMIVSPNELEDIMMNNFIKIIICNTNIKKILHGSDSLDIPYMYTHMLDGDPDKIIKFTRTLIDTRFLCEYYKLNSDIVSDNRCSIYDEDPSRSAVYFFKVISDEQQNKLAELLESMPAPHDIQWNIHKMPISQARYAAYDVLYLKVFYYRIIHVATEEDSSDIGKKNIIELYKHLLNEITRFVYLEQNGITLLMAKCKEEVDVVNNYFIRNSEGITKMIDIFNQVSLGLETSDPKVNVDSFSKVNHFKRPITTIIKRIVYGFISYRCRIYKDKSTIWTDKLDNQFIFDFLAKMKFNYLNKMFKELSKTLESRIVAICSVR